MAYAKLDYSVQQINEAGRTVGKFIREDVPSDQLAAALNIIDNYRASHNYPLNSIHVTLKGRAAFIAQKSLTAQRIKRLISIAHKLWDQSDMKLSQMQDVGGCRAVLPSIKDVYALHKLYNDRPVKHIRGTDKDYIQEPKDSGYRGIHLKYRYVGAGTSMPWNGMKIEMQLRTLLQHKWATAVEAAGTFTRQALKSSQGQQEWLRFFSLMSSVFALKEECQTIPGTPNNYEELREEIRALNSAHHIQTCFAEYHKIMPSIQNQREAAYFLLVLDPVQRQTQIIGYKKDESQRANAEYTHMESTLKGQPTQVVLVRVQSIAALKRAYPNYFFDTQDFLRELAEVTGVKV